MDYGAFDLGVFLDSLSMTFMSLWFLVFAALTVAVYYLIPLRFRWTVLLVASALFCTAAGDWKILAIPVLATVVAYFAAQMIEQTERAERKKRRMILSSAAVSLLAVLVLVKVLTAADWGNGAFLFPIGISYYTFSIIGYLADVYWDKDKAERNFFKLLTFVLFFPKILQGPIARHKNLAPQLNRGNRFSWDNFTFGMQLMLWGYIKKMVIADRIAIFTTGTFGNYQNLGGAVLVLTGILSAFQLYCDFSGCVDIARGLCQMMGIELEKNFDRPFVSKSAAEFWRRWHMSLGSWFKDYVMMPLAVSPRLIKFSGKIGKRFNRRVGKAVMTCIPTLVVWLLTGLWHGTGANYIIWGLYWGVIMMISAVFAPEIGKLTKLLKINTGSKLWGVFQVIRTFALFCVTRIITSFTAVADSLAVLKTIFTKPMLWQLFDGTLYNQGLVRQEFGLMILGVVLICTVMGLQGKMELRKSLGSCNVVFRSAVYALAFILLIVFGIYGPSYAASNFVYMNF